MARYFLNLDEDGDVTPDEEGIELANLDAARSSAIEAARSIMCHELWDGSLCLSCNVVIADVHGETLLIVPFKDAVEVRDGS